MSECKASNGTIIVIVILLIAYCFMDVRNTKQIEKINKRFDEIQLKAEK